MYRTAVVACAVALCAGGAESQTLRSQSQRADSLSAVLRAAEARLQRFDDSVKSVRLANDTVLAPPLRILVQPALRELATGASRLAADSVARIARSAADRLGNRFLVVSELSPPREDHEVVARVLEPGGQERLSMSTRADTGELAQALATLALRAIGGSADPGFRAWIGEEVHWDTMSTAAWVYPRINLVSLDVPAARACYDTNMSACASMLMDGRTEAPGRGSLRGSLVRVALQLGGEGAFERFVLAQGTPPERLAAIARVPTDSIVRAWHARMRYARVPSSDMSIGIAAMSAFWIAMCGALSLRSSRWR